MNSCCHFRVLVNPMHWTDCILAVSFLLQFPFILFIFLFWDNIRICPFVHLSILPFPRPSIHHWHFILLPLFQHLPYIGHYILNISWIPTYFFFGLIVPNIPFFFPSSFFFVFSSPHCTYLRLPYIPLGRIGFNFLRYPSIFWCSPSFGGQQQPAWREWSTKSNHLTNYD